MTGPDMAEPGAERFRIICVRLDHGPIEPGGHMAEKRNYEETEKSIRSGRIGARREFLMFTADMIAPCGQRQALPGLQRLG